MSVESDVIWSGRPWIGPQVVLRTAALVIIAIIASFFLSLSSLFAFPLLTLPLYLWVYGLLAIAWVLSLLSLLILRASWRYTLRRSSMEVVKGIVSKRTLTVSPSGFSELEVDQGIVGRILNYGSFEVRSQGGQQLNLILIKRPRDVSAKIRDVMATPTVRIATDPPIAPLSK
jgi:uncharacterized membrane protein YdbT with pleckstrin-like domain